jgi:hypothetical protein
MMLREIPLVGCPYLIIIDLKLPFVVDTYLPMVQDNITRIGKLVGLVIHV